MNGLLKYPGIALTMSERAPTPEAVVAGLAACRKVAEDLALLEEETHSHLLHAWLYGENTQDNLVIDAILVCTDLSAYTVINKSKAWKHYVRTCQNLGLTTDGVHVSDGVLGYLGDR